MSKRDDDREDLVMDFVMEGPSEALLAEYTARFPGHAAHLTAFFAAWQADGDPFHHLPAADLNPRGITCQPSRPRRQPGAE